MTHAARAFASRRQKSPGSTDLLDLLAEGDPPAFANDADHRIIFWNRGAEQLMNRTAAQTLGHLCHEVFAARDSFGNRFCAATCAVSISIAEREPIHRFEVSAGERRLPRYLGFTIFRYPDTRPGKTIVVHVMDQVNRRPEVARALEAIGERTSTPDHPDSMVAAPSDSTVVDLSQRERDVLRSIASGQSNKEIATALGISVATTRNHVQHILRKLQVHSKLEAIALAFNHGLV